MSEDASTDSPRQSARRRLLALCALLALSAAASAHHSTTMFDYERTLSVHGQVVALRWSNPHAWLKLMALDEHHAPIEWQVELGATAAMSRRGWRPDIVRAGDSILVELAPFKSGLPGGSLLRATLADGTVLAGRRPGR